MSSFRDQNRRYAQRIVRVCVFVLLLFLTVGLPIVTPIMAQNDEYKPGWAQAVDAAPAAFRGPCRVEPVGIDLWHWRGTGFTQPDGPQPQGALPGSCYNVSIITGTWDSVPHRNFSLVLSLDGLHITDSDKLSFSALRQPDGSYELRWASKPGVDIEWLYATIDGPGETNVHLHGSDGHYTWRPYDDRKFPRFFLQANDRSVNSGRYSGSNEPPIP